MPIPVCLYRAPSAAFPLTPLFVWRDLEGYIFRFWIMMLEGKDLEGRDILP